MGSRANELRSAFKDLQRINFEGIRIRLIDAEHQVVGRLGSQIATILQGKDKPIYARHKDRGDMCVVVNADKAVLTGSKWDTKLYRWHTGRPGGLKEMQAKEMWRREPTYILTRAVRGMLPKNNLLPDRMRKLRVFPGPDHPYGDTPMEVYAPPPRKLADSKKGWSMPEGFEPMNPAAYARRMRGSRWAAPGVTAPVVGFDDLLTEEERAALVGGASSGSQQQQQAAGSGKQQQGGQR